MTEKNLLKLLRDYKSGLITENATISKLKNLSLQVEDFGFASIDHGREFRQGFPEVVYSPGKTKEQLSKISTNGALATW